MQESVFSPALLSSLRSLAARASADAAKARKLYLAGEPAFSGRRYADAARAFEGALVESHPAGLLCNVAQSHRKRFNLDNFGLRPSDAALAPGAQTPTASF